MNMIIKLYSTFIMTGFILYCFYEYRRAKEKTKKISTIIAMLLLFPVLVAFWN